MDNKEKILLEGFKSYLSVEKNFSEHTLNAYCSDIVSYILWLNGTSCVDVDFNKLREYLYFIQRFDYKKTTIARKIAIPIKRPLITIPLIRVQTLQAPQDQVFQRFSLRVRRS